MSPTILDETHPQTLRAAQFEARKFQGKAAAGELVPVEKGKTPTLRQLIDGTVAGHTFRDTVAKGEPERILAAFDGILDRQLDKIAPLDLARYAKAQIDKGRKPASIVAASSQSARRTGEGCRVEADQRQSSGTVSIRRKQGRLRLAEIVLQPIERRVRYLTPEEEKRLREALRAVTGASTTTCCLRSSPA